MSAYGTLLTLMPTLSMSADIPPGSATLPFFGIQPGIVDADGTNVPMMLQSYSRREAIASNLFP